MERISEIIARTKDLLNRNNVIEAIDYLYKNKRNFSFAGDRIILLSSRFRDTRDNLNQGTITHTEYDHSRNRVVVSVLGLLNEIEQTPTFYPPESIVPQDEFEEVKKRNIETYEVLNEKLHTSILQKKLQEKEQDHAQIKDDKIKEILKEDIQILKSHLSKGTERLYQIFPQKDIIEEIGDCTFIGIDFGTSNTVVSYMCYYKDQEEFKITHPETIRFTYTRPTNHESQIVPSAIYYDKDLNEILFGNAAKKHSKNWQFNNVNYWTNFKTELGVDIGKQYYNSELGKDNELETILDPNQASEVFLKWLVNKITNFIKENQFPEKTYYTIGVPASFSAVKRRAYLKILEKIGIEATQKILIDEPNAAFLNCLLSLPKDRFEALQKKLVLVFDFGAGTCDISIIKCWEKEGGIHSENHATSSDNSLGGDDIDRRIVEEVLLEPFLEEQDLKTSYLSVEEKKDIIEGLKEVAEKLKISASNRIRRNPQLKGINKLVSTNIKAFVPYKGELLTHVGFDMSFIEFDQIMQEFCEYKEHSKNILSPVKAALTNAEMEASDVDYVILIGGSCKNPYVKNCLEHFFDQAEIVEPPDLQAHVSQGIALNTAFIYALNKEFLAPVVSETISFKTAEGRLHPLIKAGTPVPSEEKIYTGFTITQDSSDIIQIPVYASGEENILDNFKIEGNFSINDKFTLKVKVDKEKTIHLKIFQNEVELTIIPFPPFSTKVITKYEKEVKKHERKLFNLLSEISIIQISR